MGQASSLTVRLCRQLIPAETPGLGPMLRFSFVNVPIFAIIVAVLFFVPWPVGVSAAAIIQFHEPEIVRNETPRLRSSNSGHRWAVTDGNCELETELQNLELDRQRSLVRSRDCHDQHQVAAYQSEVASRQAVDARIAAVKQ